ncbi:MAG: M48 family metallopeptidase, partial [Clostridia bacterium]|nr:M48 family metallopeptidase [Clostridia bacterium]
MIKRIKLLDREIEYDLQVKRVKNINLRIKPDKSITVSANPRVPEKRIEKFILEKQEFILRALEKYGKMQKSLPKPKQYIDGETVKVFGKDFTLKVFLAKKNYVETDESFIKLYVRSIDDLSLKKKVLDKWLYNQVEEAVLKICEKVYPLFKNYCGDFPTIKFRKMTSRWGSCNFVRKILTFNYALINAPIECVEYVIYHEFTHFIE